MAGHYSKGRISSSLLMTVVLILTAAAVLVFMSIRYKGGVPDLQDYIGNMVKKMDLVSSMRANLLKSQEAEKSAVMADTDQESKKLADQSQQEADLVERDRKELDSLFVRDHTDKEMELFREFDGCWKELQKIDREILEFAVQNSSLKAAALSFGKGRETMNRFEGALKNLIDQSASSGKCGPTVSLACNAVIAGLHILNLHALHISEARDEKMDEIEAQMGQAGETVEASLKELSEQVPDEHRALLEEARGAYNEFAIVTAEVVRLSRMNTNIKSFELSLGKKRKIAAQCDEILISLQEAVRSREFKATR